MPCWWLAEDGPGASIVVFRLSISLIGFGSDGASLTAFFVGCPVRDVFAVWAFSAKESFSILRLLRLYSPIVLQATKFMRRILGSWGNQRFSEDMAVSLLHITVFF